MSVLSKNLRDALPSKPGKTLDIPADNCGMPFVFVYYRGQVLHTFIPDIANKNVFLSYLDLIFKRYNITG